MTITEVDLDLSGLEDFSPPCDSRCIVYRNFLGIVTNIVPRKCNKAATWFIQWSDPCCINKPSALRCDEHYEMMAALGYASCFECGNKVYPLRAVRL